MNVLHISNGDIGGGAAIAAYRLHNALRKQGLSSGMAVRYRQSSDPDVLSCSSRSTGFHLIERIQSRFHSIELKRTAKSVSRELAYFSDDRVPGPDMLKNLPPSDVVNLHWVSHFLDYEKFFAKFRKGLPLVWTLHDMAPLTGGCHYAMSCEKFTQTCGACPLLGSTSEGDLTRRIHKRKSTALAKLVPATTRIVAPSKWLASEALRSSLLGRFDIEVIPNGVNVETFSPRDRGTARDVLGLPKDGHVVLFSADSIRDYRKGLDLLQIALDQMKVKKSVTLAAIGSGHAPKGCVALGRIDNPRLLSFVYSAADIFVLPTRADNLPNVLVEALACGLPCVSFAVGGVPEIVRHEETGLLAGPADVDDLRRHIERLLNDDSLRGRISQRCREVAIHEYSDIIFAEKYAATYQDLVGSAQRLRGNFSSPVFPK